MNNADSPSTARDTHSSGEISLWESIQLVWNARKRIAGVTLVSAMLAVAGTYLITPQYTASITILPPQQQQSAAAALLGTLGGGLSSAASALSGLKNPSDQWVAILSSRTIADKLVNKFDLLKHYDVDKRVEARKVLERRTDKVAGKDGLITLMCTDEEPKVAAQLCSGYITALQELNGTLAISDASQRRVFYEARLKEAREKMDASSAELQRTGVAAAAMKTDPASAFALLAQLEAQATDLQIKVDVARQRLADSSPDLISLRSELASVRAQIAKVDAKDNKQGDSEYIAKFRDFKYYSALFEQYAKLYEIARADEANDAPLIQVIDEPEVPEMKSWPKRALIAALAALVVLFGQVAWLFARHALQSMQAAAEAPAKN